MKNEIHPIELLILAALVVAAAVIDLAKLATALVLTIAGWRAPQPAEPVSPADELPPAAPLVSPLLAELEALTVVQLQQLVGTRSKKHRKQQLITMAGMALAC